MSRARRCAGVGLLLLFVFAVHGAAQGSARSGAQASTRGAVSATAMAPPVLGEWRGRSTCLITPSACHDEVVVYEIRRDSVSRDSLAIDADKIVNGTRDFMGTITCGWHAPELACPMRGGWWRFTLHGDTLTGSLSLADGRRFRDIMVARVRVK